jgi:N-acetylglucosaminyldiphosphoundecaprenol N-acetyl-beta-D-mannosaminyltransferase
VEVVRERADVLGVKVSPVSLAGAVDTIEEWIARGARQYVCVTGVHGVMESQRDPELLEIHNRAGLVTPDGMPLVWISRRQGFGGVTRVYGPDLMVECCRRSVEGGYRHFLYGGAPGVPDLLAAKLTDRFPGLRIVGTHSPPFRPLTPDEDRDVCRLISEARPDFVWVGLSTPKQERWMAAHVGRIEAPVLLGVGAAFDFHAGLKSQAPAWMQARGLEWLYRAMTEPRRLGPRYLRNNPAFLLVLAVRWLSGGERKAAGATGPFGSAEL